MLRHPTIGLALLVALAVLAVPSAHAAAKPPPLATGDLMPRLGGRLLTGHDDALPDAARGRVTLVILGFSHASRHAVEEWAGRYRARFASDTSATLFEVPMIGRMGRMGGPFIEGGMRKGTPRELHGNVMVVYGDTKSWKARLGYSAAARDDPYLVLLDRRGVVRWRGQGPWDERRFESLVAEVMRESTR